jgi:possible lipoprotein
MKSLKRLFLGVLLAVAAVFLVACNSKKDNGTYVFEPTKEEMKQIVPSELQSLVGLVGDNYKRSISITINDDKGEMKIESDLAGQKSNQTVDLKVDQKSKTLVSETNQGKTEISYEVSGDVLTFKDVKNSSLKDKDKDVFSNYMKIAKFKKVK